jgi:membrane protease YdiL (CAAX protease family)/LysM repeat protein
MTLALIYLGLITIAELLTATIGAGTDFVRVGLSLHSIILVVLILHGATTRKTQTRRLLLALALAPLIRILSISLPLQNLPLIDWYLIIGGLLYLAAFVAARIMGFSWQRLGLTFKGWPIQLALGLIGFALGLIEYTILGSRPLIQSLSWETLLYPAFVLMIFTGFLEEIIFRGLIQDVSTTSMGRFGIWYCAVLFAVLHIGYLSVLDVIFVFGVGLLFGFIAYRTRSLLGVSLAHGFTNISMYLIYPFIVIGGLFSAQPFGRPQELLILPPSRTPAVQQIPALVLLVTPTPSSQVSQATPAPSVSPATGIVLTLTPTITPSPSFIYTTALTSTLTCGIPQGWVVYTVHSGDTLSGLSLLFGVSVAQLQNANCLTTTVIHTRQSLYVPFLPIPNTPSPNTATPFPSATSMLETDTPAPATPSDTPLPQTDTDTPHPAVTDTPLPVPTDTPVPVPTATSPPVPTDTPPSAPTTTPGP